MKRKPTIKDIAKALNVHHSTVSRALRDHPDVKAETKRKVQAMAGQLNYQPNVFAQNLKRNSTNFIGVIVPEIEHHFFSSAISGMEKVAYEAGYILLICQSNEDYQREVVNTRALISNKAAGLIVSVSQTTHDYEHFKRFIDDNGKIVFFDRVIEALSTPKVIVNDYEGAFTATKHLIGCGRKRIAHLAGSRQVSITRARLNGYKDALKSHGLEYDENLVYFGGFHEKDGCTGMSTLLDRNEAIDAVFAVNDPCAIGAYESIKKRGLVIPDDIAVIGFTDNPIAAFVSPPLSTIAQPACQMGEEAARLLIRQIRGLNELGENYTKILNTKLIVRESTKKNGAEL